MGTRIWPVVHIGEQITLTPHLAGLESAAQMAMPPAHIMTSLGHHVTGIHAFIIILSFPFALTAAV